MTFRYNDCWIASLSHPKRRYRLGVSENRGLRCGNIILRTKLRNRCSTGIITRLKTFRKIVWLINVSWEKRKLHTMVLIRNVPEEWYFEYLGMHMGRPWSTGLG
jgi:hypothetical protein